MKSHGNRLVSFVIFLAVISIFPLQAKCETQPESKQDKEEKETSCTYTKEYITALEFLRKQKDLALPEADARKVAEKVSMGCTGAAQRFVKVTRILSHSGVSGHDSVQTGLDFASRSDAEAETFVVVFMTAFLQEYLDLDMKASLRMARSLSTEFQGDTKAVRKDFEKLIKFCVSTKELDLPRPQCGSFAARIAHRGEKFDGAIADAFIRTFNFLRSESGPGLITGQALQLAEQLVAGGRDSTDNFIQAFKYGISSKGLGYSTQDAMQFAKRMASADKK